jgi:hypothetical protein
MQGLMLAGQVTKATLFYSISILFLGGGYWGFAYTLSHSTSLFVMGFF